MKTIRLLLLVLLCAFAAQAQTTSISGTITAAGGQVYANGTYTFQLVGGNAPFYLGGVQMTLAQTTITGQLNSSGAFTSVAVGKTASISPAGTSWLFTACPLASAPCWSQNIGIVSGTTLDISTTITPPAIKVTPTPNVLPLAYQDSEIQGPVVGTNYYNLTLASARICISISGGVCTWSAEGSVTSVFGRTGAVAAQKGDYTAAQVTGAMPQFAGYTIFLATDSTCTVPSTSGTSVCARNNSTGAFDYNSADTAVVLNDITVAYATVGGHLFFKNGIYPINSMTVESATGCSSFESSGAQLAYGVGFPAQASYNPGVQWIIEGETTSVWQGEEGSTSVNANGVVFNVTSTAVSSVTAGSVLAGFWARPITNCTLTNGANISNDLIYKNVTLRFPLNTRGNEVAFASYFAGDVQYENVVADFNVSYNTIATGSAPTVGTWNSIGMTSTISSSGNWQDFRQTYVTGYNFGYDFQSEHVTGTTITAIYNNNAAEFGRSGGVIYHPIKIIHFIDQENLNGITLGPQMSQGSRIDMDLDIELGIANWYARTTGAHTEANCGYTTGVWWYQSVKQNSGLVAELPASNLFSSCGQNIQAFEGTAPPAIALTPISDTFTRPNSSASTTTNGLGPMWASGTQGGNGNLTIVSNSARINVSGAGSGYSVYLATPFNADQFSKATCSILTAAADYCEVMVRGSTNPAVQTYYTYYEGGTAATGRGILKVVAGVSTGLASQTASAGSAGDVLELDVVGNTLWAYRNGALDTSFTNPVVDSSITSGAPGLNMVWAAANGAAMTNWSGGGFPTKTGTDSIYNNPAYATRYNTTTNCAAVGTAASPSVVSCASAAAGQFSCATNATGATCTVNTTAVTANSEIFVQDSDTAVTGTRLGVTCNTSTAIDPVSRLLASSVAGTSFTINLGTVTTNPACFSYNIVN